MPCSSGAGASATHSLGGAGYLEDPDEEDDDAHGAHHAAVVVQEGFPAAAAPEVELLRLVVVAVVSRVVGDLVLDAGSRGAGVAAAERDAVHQVPSVHVAFDPTMDKGRRQRECTQTRIDICWSKLARGRKAKARWMFHHTSWPRHFSAFPVYTAVFVPGIFPL